MFADKIRLCELLILGLDGDSWPITASFRSSARISVLISGGGWAACRIKSAISCRKQPIRRGNVIELMGQRQPAAEKASADVRGNFVLAGCPPHAQGDKMESIRLNSYVSTDAFPKRRAILATLSAMVVLGLLPLTAAAESEDSASGRPLRPGIVYVESNIATPNGNTILAYQRDSDGQLTPLPGSPFATRGTGIVDPSLALGPFDSDQLMITNPEHTLLFAVNPGSNSIAVFRIGAGGGLAHVDGSPFASGGINPVSIGLSRDTLVVVNKAMDPNQASHTPSYASFRISPEGHLSPVALSIKTVATGASPSQALVSPGGTILFGADFLAGELQSFAIRPDGSLDQNLPQRLPDAAFTGSAAPRFPLGLAAHPNRPVVYVGLVTISRIGVYQYDAQGRLSFVKTVADTGAGPCWVRVSLDGTRMYSSNTGDNSISVYDTSDAFNPVQIQKYPLKGVGSSFQLELDPANKYLYVLSQRASVATPIGQGNNLHVVHIKHDGRLLEEESLPLTLPVASNVRPQGLATF